MGIRLKFRMAMSRLKYIGEGSENAVGDRAAGGGRGQKKCKKNPAVKRGLNE